MKILKRIFIGLIGLIVLVLIIALFVKKDFALEREVTINKPKQQVFDYLKSLKNQDEWTNWAKMDPDMKKEFRGTDGTVGCVSAWDGKKAGQGEQELTKITDGQRLDFELRFLKPMKATNYAYLTTEASGDNQTKVKWGFNGRVPYPMNIMLLCVDMDKEVGNDFEAGLSNLKDVLEKR